MGLIVIALLPVFLGGIGGFAFFKARQSIKEEVQLSLTTIAEQKNRQIELWLSGIRQDAILFSGQTWMSQNIEEWINGGKQDDALKNTIQVQLVNILENRHYRSLAVFDAKGQPILEVGEPDATDFSPHVLDSIRNGKPEFVNLHRIRGGQIVLGMVSPLVTQSGRAFAGLFLDVNAGDYLYPLLKSWPVPHATAETILAQRTGQAIEYVSPLYLSNIPAMDKRLPLDTPQLPAAASLHGFSGIYKNGVDYRGQPVLSYVAPVKGTSWIIEAKMDKNEAYAKTHRLGWFTGLAFVVILFSSYWIVWLVWRNHSLLKLQIVNQQLELRVYDRTQELESVLHTARDGFIVANGNGGLVKVNPALSRMLGYSEDELLGMSIADFDVGEDSAQFAAHLEKIKREGGDRFQTRLRCMDGKIITVDISVTYLEQQQGKLFYFIRNISERLRLQEELRQTAERLSLATKAAGIGVWDWWVKEDRLIWDENIYAMYGVKPESFQASYQLWREAVHPDDKEYAESQIWAAWKSNDEFRADYRIVWPDGTVRHIEDVGRFFRDNNGDLYRVVGVNMDITDKKMAEQELAENEMRWLVALDSHSMGVWDWSLNTGKVLYSSRWKTMLGYSDEDIEGSFGAWECLIHPDDKGIVMESLEDYFLGNQPGFNADIRLRTKEGSYRWIRTCGKVTDWSPDGRPVRMIGTHTDIDEHKRAESLLKEREETFRKLFQDSLDPVLIMKGIQFVECNQAALDLLHLPKEQLIGLTPADISVEFQEDGRKSEEVVKETFNVLSNGEGCRFDWHCLRKDGSDFHVEVSLTPVTISGAPFFYCGWRDITERKQITKALAEAKEAAEAANRAKSAFLANMSHELRTPLNSILGKAQLIKTQDLNDKVNRQIQSILKAAQHLLAIVNDILDISKIEAGKLRLEMSDFPLQEKIKEILDMFAEKVDGLGVFLSFAIDPSLPPVLKGDELRIRQMLFNLVGNAVKFTEQGTVTIRVLRLEPGDETFRVRFEVQDTGVGISPENQLRLFNYFEQTDNQSTRQYGGTGLGLAICKRLAERMGGSVGVSSAIGRGSTFWFTIPLSKSSQGISRQEDKRPIEYLTRRLAQEYAGTRVLLVEDNVINQEITVELLEEVGMSVDLASNGLEGVSRVKDQAYDLILMDIQMPKMDGVEATRAIRSLPHRADIPIVALTANAFAEDIAHYRSSGMNGHVAKPIIIKELYETILHCLSARPNQGKKRVNLAPPPPVPSAPADKSKIDRLADIAGVDTQAGLNSLAGKSASYIKQLRKFAERQPSEMQHLREALEEGDLVTAKRITHTLKGLAGTLGATSLQPNVQRLNEAFRENSELESLSQLGEAVIAEYAGLAEAILSALTEK